MFSPPPNFKSVPTLMVVAVFWIKVQIEEASFYCWIIKSCFACVENIIVGLGL